MDFEARERLGAADALVVDDCHELWVCRRKPALAWLERHGIQLHDAPGMKAAMMDDLTYHDFWREAGCLGATGELEYPHEVVQWIAKLLAEGAERLRIPFEWLLVIPNYEDEGRRIRFIDSSDHTERVGCLEMDPVSYEEDWPPIWNVKLDDGSTRPFNAEGWRFEG